VAVWDGAHVFRKWQVRFVPRQSVVQFPCCKVVTLPP